MSIEQVRNMKIKIVCDKFVTEGPGKLFHKIGNNSIQVDCKPNNIDDNQCPVIPHYGNDNPPK